MEIFVDPGGPEGKSETLYDQLRAGIVSGRFERGTRLPPSRVLAAELGVSRSTVTTVYGRLVAEGFIEGLGSAGSFVSYQMRPADRAERPSALSAVTAGLADVAAWSLGGFDAVPPEYDLRTGRPDPALFPRVEWRRAVGRAFDVAPEGYQHPAGLPTLRRALAHWIGRSRGVEAEPEQVLVTAGAQQAMDIAGRLLLRPGDVVAVEDPGYPPAASLLSSLGAVVEPVPVDADGLVVDELPSATRMVYVTPSHQSPTGVVMSMPRRQQLLRTATAGGIAIIEDDYDSEYRHGDRPLEPLYRLDGTGRVLYVGTFSKTLSPSLRLGFLVLPPALVDDAVKLRSLMDWQPPASSQAALRSFIVDGHLDRHLRATRRIYSERFALVADCFRDLAKQGLLTEVMPSAAGLHLTAHLRPGIAEQRVRTVAATQGVALPNYGQCWRGDPRSEGITVGFGAIPTAALPDALRRLETSLMRTQDRRFRHSV